MTNFVANKSLITNSMLSDLKYDMDIQKNAKMTPTTNEITQLDMIIFHESDINAASYYLAKSIDDPTNSSQIRCVFVQESCVDRFSGTLKSKLKTYSNDELSSQNFKDTIEKSNEILSKLNAETIVPDTFSNYAVPLVWNFPQEHFRVDGKALPVVCLFSFRTVKEAITMVKKESNCKTTSIWCANHAMAYEVMAGTAFRDYYLNCCNVSWTPIKEYISKEQPFALIENSYHYEILQMSSGIKSIVFPLGTSFAN